MINIGSFPDSVALIEAIVTAGAVFRPKGSNNIEGLNE